MKGMIGILKQCQGCSRAECLTKRFERIEACERVTGSLQEQHRHLNLEQMLAALGGRAIGRVERKAEKRNAANVGERRDRLSLRCHAAAERLAAGDQRQLW